MIDQFPLTSQNAHPYLQILDMERTSYHLLLVTIRLINFHQQRPYIRIKKRKSNKRTSTRRSLMLSSANKESFKFWPLSPLMSMAKSSFSSICALTLLISFDTSCILCKPTTTTKYPVNSLQTHKYIKFNQPSAKQQYNNHFNEPI